MQIWYLVSPIRSRRGARGSLIRQLVCASTTHQALAGALDFLLTQAALVRELGVLSIDLITRNHAASSSALEPAVLLLAVALAVMALLAAGLTGTGVAKTGVNLPRGGTTESLGRGSPCLTSSRTRTLYLADVVWLKGPVRRRGACWDSLCVEFWSSVGLAGNATWLVLCERQQ